MLYRILHPKCTVHYAATKEVANMVSDDLIVRYGDKTEVTECKDKTFMIDFGGAMFQGEKPIEFQIDGFTYCIWAHQYLMALNKLNVAISNPRVGSFIKIHGAWTSIAMSLAHAEALRDTIKSNSEELKELESAFLSRFDEAMSDLRTKGVLASNAKVKSKLEEN
jgi:hypothetical protein